MAATSMNDIKSRIKSVGSTMQITKAMELVATSKLRRAKAKLESSRSFYQTLADAINSIKSSSDVQQSAWFADNGSQRTLYIVIAGDRGLAGGYNSNVFKLTESIKDENDAVYLPIGKKALEYYRHKGVNIYSEAFEYVSDFSVGDSIAISNSICNGFERADFGRAVIVYTQFNSMLQQTPAHSVLLPLEERKTEESIHFDPLYDGTLSEILDRIVPNYVGGVIYSTVCESIASELGARRCAMESANNNAQEIIDTLRLQFNRARQAVITQEITEIVSGSEAL